MTRKQKRISIIVGALALLSLGMYVIFNTLGDTMVFFYTPSQIAEKGVKPGARIRLGGMVLAGSWKKQPPAINDFAITDTIKTMQVNFVGLVPDLFREGQGVVTEGILNADGTFKADTVLAKHDENYMPKEIADTLKAKGVKLGKSAAQ
jgi:cytochrome c-type biogenesis protein CcmE